MTFILRLFALTLTLSLVACSEDIPIERDNGDNPDDAPPIDDDDSAGDKMDAGRRDGGALDAAVKPSDAGEEDAGAGDAQVADARADAAVPPGMDASIGEADDAGKEEDAGGEPAEEDAGKDAGEDAGKDAGKDAAAAAEDAGKDAAAPAEDAGGDLTDAGADQCIEVSCLTDYACFLANEASGCGFVGCPLGGGFCR